MADAEGIPRFQPPRVKEEEEAAAAAALPLIPHPPRGRSDAFGGKPYGNGSKRRKSAPSEVGISRRGGGAGGGRDGFGSVEEAPTVLPTKQPVGNLGTPEARRKRGWEGGGGTSYADRRKSKVWNYYRKSGDAYVECNVCKKQLSFHNSTTTMREHLARKHGIRDAPLAHPKDEGGGAGERAARETGGENPRRAAAAAYPVGADSGSEALAELVLGLVFRDLHPLTVVKDRGFGLLVGYLEPGARLPTPAQLGEALRRRYGCVRQRLERYLRTAQAVTLSAERWRSSLGQTYVTLAANLVDGEWRRARCALETRPAPYDGGDSREGFGAVLSAFGLAGKTLFCVTDDGEAGEAGGSELGCAARTLQLCVAAGLGAEQVRETLEAARGIVRYFREDVKAARSLGGKLESINKTAAGLTADTGSRWISTAEMCESLLELKWAVMSVLEEQPKGSAAGRNLADGQWKLLQDLVTVLRTIRIATAFLSEEQNVSVSSLMPCIHGIAAAIGQRAEEAGAVVEAVVGNIRTELTRRWGLADDEKLLANPAFIASFLDPRFKELRFLNPGMRRQIHERVKTLLSRDLNQPAPAAPSFWTPNPDFRTESGEGGVRAPPPAEGSSAASSQSVYDILLGKDPTESMPEIHQQLENYIVEPLCKRTTDPLDWWKDNERRFPAVARLGRRYLAIPATAAPPRQAFAGGESTLEHRRAVLPPENLDLILFLHQNEEFLGSVEKF